LTFSCYLDNIQGCLNRRHVGRSLSIFEKNPNKKKKKVTKLFHTSDTYTKRDYLVKSLFPAHEDPISESEDEQCDPEFNIEGD